MRTQLDRRVVRLESSHSAKGEASAFDMSKLSTGLLRRLLEAEGDASGLSADDWAELDAARIEPLGGTA